ncbi:SAV_915 family protein [Streptomyces sp. NPDC016309]|uniref:SAV_915 family protein n=1 Tax=Streptomyces sp. NPDC016309 TaxID=3364965 RepID=UPI0036F759C3
MPTIPCGDGPEPSPPAPAGPLYVPVRPGPRGCAVRLFRTSCGARTAIGFTTAPRLTAALGPDQAWIRLTRPALRTLTAPLGVTTLSVDPRLTAPAATPVPSPAGPGRTTAPAPSRWTGPLRTG